MSHRVLASTGVLATVIGVGLLAPVAVTGQTQTAVADTRTPPRPAHGQPDIGGVWTNFDPTPFEAPSDVDITRLTLLVGGLLTLPWGAIPASLGGVICLAFAFSWMARVIIAGQVEATFGLLLITVGVMALPLESVPRNIVGVILLVVGVWWVALRVLRHEAEQAARE